MQRMNDRRQSFLFTGICSCLVGIFLIAGLLAFTARPAAAAAPIRLAWGHAWSEFYNDLWEAMGKRVEERSNNAVKYEYFWGGSLVPAREERKLVSEGTVDLTNIHPIYYPDMIMSGWTWALPFNPENNLIMAKLIHEVYKEFPQMQQEITRSPVHIIGQWSNAPYDFNGKFRFTKLSDLKGKKVIAQGKYEPQWFEAAGAAAVNVTAPEKFSALQSGLAEGSTGRVDYFLDLKFHDAGARYVTYAGLGSRTGNGYYVMNKKKWDSLPANVQKVIHEEWDRFAFETAPKYMETNAPIWRERVIKGGFEVDVLADTEKREWARRIEPIIKSYAQDIDKAYNQRGLGARFIKFIQTKQKELGAPIYHEFKVD